MTKRTIAIEERAKVLYICIHNSKQDYYAVVDCSTVEVFEFNNVGKAMDKFDEIKQRFYEKNPLS